MNKTAITLIEAALALMKDDPETPKRGRPRKYIRHVQLPPRQATVRPNPRPRIRPRPRPRPQKALGSTPAGE